MTAIFQDYCNPDGKLRVDLNPPGTTFHRGMAVNPVAMAVHAVLNGTIVPPGNGAYIPSSEFVASLRNSLILDRGVGDPTFTRASVATVVDFEGRIIPVLSGEARFTGARRVRNLVGSSGNLTSGWTYTDITNEIGATDPDGGATAYTLTANGANKQWIRYANLPSGLASGILGWSVWLKRRTGSGPIALYKTTGASQVIALTTSWKRFFVSSTGDAAGLVGIIISTSGDAIDVWHPMAEELTGQSNQNPSEYVSVGVKPAPYHGAGVDGVKYFDTENGNTVTDHVVTEATGAAIADATLKGYLAEGSRQNLCLQSADFGTTWVRGTDEALTTNAAVAPDGTTTADLIAHTVSATSTTAFRYQTVTIATATAHTFSVFAKKKDVDFINITVYDGTIGVRYWYNVNTGVVGSTANIGAGLSGVSASIESFANGFYRCKLSFTSTAVAATLFYVSACDADASLNLSSGVGNYFWGAQLEAASFASSYIPTTTAAVTRAADLLQYPVTGNMNNAVGTCSAEFTRTVATNGAFVVGTTSPLYNTLMHGSSYAQIGMYDGATEVVGPSGASLSVRGATRWGNSVCQVAANGALGTAGAFDGAMGILALNIGTGIGGELFGNIRNVRIWREALSNDQLEALTSPTPTQYLSGIPFTPAGQVMIGDGPKVSPISGGGYTNADGLLSVGGEPDGIYQGVGYNVDNGIPIDQYAAEFTFIAPLTHSLDLLAGVGEATFTRASTATVMGYAPDAMPWDEQKMLVCAANEARFSGARRISEGVWSDKFADGTAIPDYELKGYLAEGSRTNVLWPSNDLTNAQWTVRGTAAVTKNATGPDGVANSATTCVVNTSAGPNDLYYTTQLSGLGAGTSGALCFWLKKTTAAGTLRIQNASDSTRGNFDVNLASLGAGWELITAAHAAVTVNSAWSSSAGGFVQPQLFAQSGGPLTFAVFGIQYETGVSFSSSTILTATAAVTRNADALTYPTSGNVLVDTGTIYLEYAPASTDVGGVTNKALLRLTAGAADRQISNIVASQMNFWQNGDKSHAAYSPVIGTAIKLAARYTTTAGDTVICSNGTLATPGTMAAAAAAIDANLGIGYDLASSFAWGNVRNAKIAKVAVPDSYLEYMTA